MRWSIMIDIFHIDSRRRYEKEGPTTSVKTTTTFPLVVLFLFHHRTRWFHHNLFLCETDDKKTPTSYRRVWRRREQPATRTSMSSSPRSQCICTVSMKRVSPNEETKIVLWLRGLLVWIISLLEF
jgi:hypothetical protein